MDRDELIRKAIEDNIGFSLCHELELQDWLAQFWQLSLFCVALKFDLKAPDFITLDKLSTGMWVDDDDGKGYAACPWLPLYSDYFVGQTKVGADG